MESVIAKPALKLIRSTVADGSDNRKLSATTNRALPPKATSMAVWALTAPRNGISNQETPIRKAFCTAANLAGALRVATIR